MAQLARARHIPMAPHFLHDLHVHLLCAVPNAFILEYLPLLDDVLEYPLDVAGGYARPPDRPGHGISFRGQVMDPHLTDRSVTS